MHKFAITAICVGILCFFNPSFARVLELVTLQYPPYEYEENGEPTGFAVEVVREAFKRLQQPVSINILPWARSIQMIKEGSADAIFTFYKTAEREDFVDYSTEILCTQIVSLFVLKDSRISYNGDLKKLSDKTFGVVRAVSYGKIFDDAAKSGVIKLDITNTMDMNIQKFFAGRFDILINNKYGALDFFKKEKLTSKVIELKPEVEVIPSYIAFSKKKSLGSLRDNFDATLIEMKNDGTYQKIERKYLNN